MVILSLGLCYHVIHIHFDLLMHHVMKQRYHFSLIRCPAFFSLKGMTLWQKVPYIIKNVVFSISFEAILI